MKVARAPRQPEGSVAQLDEAFLDGEVGGLRRPERPGLDLIERATGRVI